MRVEFELESDITAVVRNKLNALLSNERNHGAVLRNAAQAVGQAITDYVPRSDRPPTVHHLQDFEASEQGVIRWFGRGYHDVNYAQKVFYNREGHTFHVRYPGHNPRAHWTEILYDRGVMSQVEDGVKKVLQDAAHELN